MKICLNNYSESDKGELVGLNTASSICSCALISVASSVFCLGIAKLEINDKTIR